MGNFARPASFQLGQLVHHVGPAKAIGIVVGFLFRPLDRALVRWPAGGSTWERLDDLEHAVAPIGAPALAALPEHVRRRLDLGRLPVEAAASRPVQASDWTPCDACDELIAPGQSAFEIAVVHQSLRLRVHPVCHLLWKAERRRRRQQRAS
jgi:hypothetical protein